MRSTGTFILNKTINKHNVINLVYVEPIMKTIVYNYISFSYWKKWTKKISSKYQ